MRILNEEGDLVTFQAGRTSFTCSKSGVIYRDWLRIKEGSPPEERHFTSSYVFSPVTEEGVYPFSKPEATRELPPVVKLPDSQLQERQSRMRDLRKKSALLGWCFHERDICTGKCLVLDKIAELEKKLLGEV